MSSQAPEDAANDSRIRNRKTVWQYRPHMPRSRQWRLVALLFLLAGLLVVWRWREPRHATEPQQPAAFTGKAPTDAQVRAVLALEAQERDVDRTVWAAELEAQRHEDVFLALWDALNQATDPFATLAGFA